MKSALDKLTIEEVDAEICRLDEVYKMHRRNLRAVRRAVESRATVKETLQRLETDNEPDKPAKPETGEA